MIFANIPMAAKKQHHTVKNMVVAGNSKLQINSKVEMTSFIIKDDATLQNNHKLQIEQMEWISGTLKGTKTQVL